MSLPFRFWKCACCGNTAVKQAYQGLQLYSRTRQIGEVVTLIVSPTNEWGGNGGHYKRRSMSPKSSN
jgi:hypothetical protein